MSTLEGVLPKSNSGMWNSKMSLRLSAFLYGGRSEIPHCVRNRLRNLMKYNEIATPRPLQFLMVGVRNDKKGFGQHALYIDLKISSTSFSLMGPIAAIVYFFGLRYSVINSFICFSLTVRILLIISSIELVFFK